MVDCTSQLFYTKNPNIVAPSDNLSLFYFAFLSFALWKDLPPFLHPLCSSYLNRCQRKVVFNNMSGLNQGKRLLVFGPQALSSHGAGFRGLQSSAKQLQWIVDTIADLPSCWNELVGSFPKYNAIKGTSILQSLKEWINTGKFGDYETQNLPNIILSPLVIITHITEYKNYRDAIAPNDSFQSSTETLGFCMGFLSALAVSISKDEQDIERYGSTAIRLAMIIGGIVDAQEVLNSHGSSKSVATAWNSLKAENELKAILKQFPEVRCLERKKVPDWLADFCKNRRIFRFLMMNNEPL